VYEFRFLDADGEPKTSGGSGKAVHYSLRITEGMRCKGTVVCKQQFPHKRMTDFTPATQSSQVENANKSRIKQRNGKIRLPRNPRLLTEQEKICHMCLRRRPIGLC